MRQTHGSRRNRRDQIADFFAQYLGRRFDTAELHAHFGSAFRSRVREINKDPASPITIRKQTRRLADGRELSLYWSEPRNAAPSLFQRPTSSPALSPDFEASAVERVRQRRIDRGR